MKILAAVPTFETIMPECFRSIFHMAQETDHDVDFEFVKGYDCAKARNEIVLKARDHDYVLMIDSDVIVPADALDLLIEGEPDVCLGLYPVKNTVKGEAEIFKLGGKDFTDRYTYEEIDRRRALTGAGRIEVKGGGMGCALIRVAVFDRLQFPWFKYVTHPDGRILSEDLWFCGHLGLAGLKVYADLRVRCGHATRGFQYE